MIMWLGGRIGRRGGRPWLLDECEGFEGYILSLHSEAFWWRYHGFVARFIVLNTFDVI
jgi:hypothetical protein